MSYEVAVCIPRLDDQVQRDIMNKLVQMTTENAKYADFHFNILTTASDVHEITTAWSGEISIFNMLDCIDADVLLVFPERFYIKRILEKVINSAKARNIPIISVGGKIEGIVSIGYETGNCMRKIVAHIIEKHGCKYINYISGYKCMEETDERLKAFKDVMTEHGLPVEEDRIGFGEFWDFPTEQVMESFYKSTLPFPEAIICANDVMAITAISSLRQHGYSVPDDVLVTGFDGIEMERFHNPRLTTGSVDYEAIATTLFDYIEKITNGVTLPDFTAIDCKERFSESCGCTPTGDEAYQPFASLWKETSSDSSFNDMVISLSTSLKLSSSMYDMIRSITEFFNHLWTSELRVCICSDFINDISHEFNYCKKELASTMYSVIERSYDQQVITCEGKSFPIANIIPDKLYGRQDRFHTILYSIHYNDKVFGYIASNVALNHICLYQIRALSKHLGFVFERIATYKYMESINRRLEETYIYDSMTGLLSRNGYYTVTKKRIEPLLKENKRIVIVSVDLDNLKDINDKYGHDCGDTAIKLIAETLRDYIGDSGISARFGGDEFVGLRVFDGSTEEFVCRFSEEFPKAIAEKVESRNLEYNVSASFGIISLLTKTMPSLEEGIKSADVLMYAQKRAKKRVRSNPYQ